MRIEKSTRKGFTLIELLVVIAVIALLMAIVLPSLRKAKLYAQKIICRNNIRQQCLGVMLYSDDNDSWVPTIDTGFWLWDLSFWSTNQISNYAGFDNNEMYYCPANQLKQADDARFWQFSWCNTWTGVDFTQPVPLRDESNLDMNEQQGYYRVMPTLYMFDRIDGDGNSTLPATLESDKEAKWISKLSNVRATSSVLMLMDNVISEMDEVNFFEIDDGGIGDWNTFDSSNHPSSHKFPGTNYLKPDGANTGYADGHVDWRDFEEMEVQINSENRVLFWW